MKVKEVTCNEDLAKLIVETIGGRYVIEGGTSVVYESKGNKRYTCRFTTDDYVNVRPATSYPSDGLIAMVGAEGLLCKLVYSDHDPATIGIADAVTIDEFFVY